MRDRRPPARDVDHLRNCTQSQSNPSWPDRRQRAPRGHCRIQRIEAPVERQQTVRALDHIGSADRPTLIAWSMRSSAASGDFSAIAMRSRPATGCEPWY